MEGHWKFLGGPEGFLEVKILKAKYQVNLEFPVGREGAKQKTFHGGSMDIFGNCTINQFTATMVNLSCERKITHKIQFATAKG